MGLFDLPAPLFDLLDAALGTVLPAGLRLVLWGIAGAVVSMGLYWLLSPQGRISAVKAEALRARHALDAHEGAFGEAWPLIGAMLKASFRQLGLVTGPAILASLPVLFLLAWLSTAYGYQLPEPASEAVVEVAPDTYAGRLEDNGPGRPDLVVVDGPAELLRLPLEAPVPTVHERQWWNLLFGNPAGYLPDGGPVERVEIALPERRFLPFGPAWLGAWYTVFFTALIVASLAIKVLWRIE